jgi:hypothetical protein
MARYEMKLPDDIMKDIEKIHKDAPQIFEKMTQAGAEAAYKNILRNMKSSFKSTSMLEQHLKITKPYRTYQGHNVNTKVAFYGYNQEGVPVPLIVIAREYGTSRGEAKKPFVRRSFKKSEIEAVMKKVQKEESRGLLE